MRENSIIDYYYSNTDSLWCDLDDEYQKRYLNSLLPILLSISNEIPINLAIDVGYGGDAYNAIITSILRESDRM